MPKLDGTGPEGDGSQNGRRLGICSEIPEKEKLQKLGVGMGKHRKSVDTDMEGKGKRLKSWKQ